MSKWVDGEWLLNFFEPYPNDYQTPLGTLRACIDDAPTIDIPTWIPCSEGLPEHYEDVLITDEYDDVSIASIEFFERLPDPWQWADENGYHICYKVLAWMPRPHPYKKKKR